MKAYELMIGDWVQFHGKNFRVTVIDGSHIYLKSTDGECTDQMACRLDPVPITREILENNRFIRRSSEGYPEHYRYELPSENMVFKVFALYDSDFSFNINECAMMIKYIHELQHAVMLCKIEKEIVL